MKISEVPLYQVMFAAGLTRSSVIQVMLMDLDALTVVGGVDNVSVDTGTCTNIVVLMLSDIRL